MRFEYEQTFFLCCGWQHRLDAAGTLYHVIWLLNLSTGQHWPNRSQDQKLDTDPVRLACLEAIREL